MASLDHDLHEASDPRTTPGRLLELASHPVVAVRQRVAGNPSTPLDALLSLLEAWPDEVTGNASLLTYQLSDPLFLHRATSFQRWQWAAGERTPAWALEQLACDPVSDVRVALATSERCPPELLARLARDPVDEVREGVYENPRCAELLAWRVLHMHGPEAELVIPYLPVELLELVVEQASRPAEDDLGPLSRKSLWNALKLRAVVARPDCPPALLLRVIDVFSAKGDLSGLTEVARHPSCPPPALFWLCLRPLILSKIPRNGTPGAIFRCVRTRNKAVSPLLAVVSNPSCPPEVLRWLVDTHPSGRVRVVVAGRPDCPIEALAQMSSDSYPLVRWAVALHPRCPDERRACLLADEEVQAAMERCTDEPAQIDPEQVYAQRLRERESERGQRHAQRLLELVEREYGQAVRSLPAEDRWSEEPMPWTPVEETAVDGSPDQTHVRREEDPARGGPSGRSRSPGGRIASSELAPGRGVLVSLMLWMASWRRCSPWLARRLLHLALARDGRPGDR